MQLDNFSGGSKLRDEDTFKDIIQSGYSCTGC